MSRSISYISTIPPRPQIVEQRFRNVLPFKIRRRAALSNESVNQ